MPPSLRVLLVTACLAFGISHVVALPPTLEDLDSVNFALGVEAFDVRAGRPHAPGYPVFIAMGKVSTAVVAAAAPAWSRDRQAAVGLALWGVAAGAAAALVLAALWLAMGLPPATAATAALLTVVAPLFWLNASRPLTDMTGLVGALVVQAALLRGLRRLNHTEAATLPREWLWAALASGLLIGVRSQTMWLTGPLLCWCAGSLLRRRQWRAALSLTAAAAAGVLVWLPPLLLSSGGAPGYLAALSRQGTDDFSGVQMLATQPSWSLFTTALARTFHEPWHHALLAWTVLGFAALGVARMAHRSRQALGLIALAFGPYLVFHLAFQESETIRYGLPLLVPVCGLAAFGLQAFGTRTLAAGGGVLVSASLIVAVPPLQGYVAEGAPIFRIFQDLEARTAKTDGGPVTLGMHHRVASEARQAIVWTREAWAFTLLETDPGLEVASMTNHFLTGGGPVWFLADPLRRDLHAIDPQSREHESSARWPPATRALIPFSRPSDVDAWFVRPPTWMLGSGWALTPEMAGITALRRAEPHRRPAEAFIRRVPTPLRMLIAGRHLGKGEGMADISVTLDGRQIAGWRIGGAERRFEEWLDLPSGVPAGEGPYATLNVTVRSESGRPPPVGLEYFDAAPGTDVMWSYSDGWHEPELDPRTGRVWRWMGPRGVIRVEGGAGELTIRIEGESPARYFDAGSELVVRADGVEVGRATLTTDFSEVFVVPAAENATGGGAQTRLITLDTSQVMVPAERGDSPDRRELGLRVYRVTASRTGQATSIR